MNMRLFLIAATSISSIGTVIALVLPGERGFAPGLALISALLSLVCLAYFVVTMRKKTDRPGSAETGTINEKTARNLTELLSEISILLSGTTDNTGRTNDNSLLGKILASRNINEMVSLISAAEELARKSERIVNALSNRVLTDAQVLFPLANSVFKAVPEKTEEAAFALMEKFLSVRDASGKAAKSAQEIRKDLEDTQSVNSIYFTAENSRNMVRAERASIRELSLCTRENQEHLRAMKGEIDAGLDLLKNITEITERSKLIAFNMSIEAARMGEKGRGVKVIVTELHKLNDRTFDFSNQVAKLLHRFRDYNTLLVNNMDEKASVVVLNVERGIDAAEAAVETLIKASQKTESFTREIALMSESINHGLDGVLESLQFQDITRQMIEGGQAALAELKKSCDESLRETGIQLDTRVVSGRFDDTKKRLIENAKTKGEKNALMEVRL